MKRTTVYEFADTGMQFEYTEGDAEFRITDSAWEPEDGEQVDYTMSAETAFEMRAALIEITDKIHQAGDSR